MRVVFLTHNFPRASGDVSGNFLATLAVALRERGIDVRVIAPSDRGEVGNSEMDGVPVRRVRYASAGRETLAYRGTMAEAARSPIGAFTAIALGRAMRGAARQELDAGADLIHAHWWIPGGLAAPPHAPLVITLHGTDAMLLERSALARLLAKPLFRRAQVVTTVSARAAELVARHTGRVVDPFHQQPMPVQTDRFIVGRGGQGLIVVARLTQQKRVHLAIEALAEMRRRGSALDLTIVGDGPERGALEALAAHLGVADAVTFRGAQPADVVAELLSTSDLALFPARHEGFGLAAAEALMCGVPVVACTDGGGVLEVVSRTGAGRVTEPQATALAAASLELLQASGARAAAAIEGDRWRSHLSPATVAERCESWYHEALRV
ncbi:MAG: glycosyltransferase family 4 protein [Gemmatimonadales bacterium]